MPSADVPVDARPAVPLRPTTVAVLPWTPSAPVEGWDGLGAGLAGVVTSQLAPVDGLVLVERARLDALLGELELSGTDFVDPTTAAQLGHGLGAELLVVGSFSVVGGELVMDGRLVRVATGEVLNAGSARSPLDAWDRAAGEVVAALVHELGARLAERPPPPKDLRAVAAYGQGVEARSQGDDAGARAAFGRARGWLPADVALADLDAVVERARASLDAVTDQARRDALDALDPSDPADATVRFALLTEEGQWCALAEAQRQWLERSRWRAPSPSREALARRTRALGLTGDPALVDLRPRSDADFLFGPDPIEVRAGWLAAVQRCDPDLGRVAGAWRQAIGSVHTGSSRDLPLGFELEAGLAWLLARHTGTVPADFPARVEAIGSRAALGRADEVRQAATGFRLRGNLPDDDLVAFGQAVTVGDPAWIDLTPGPCRAWVYADAPLVTRLLDDLRRSSGVGDGLHHVQIEQLGAIAWLYGVRGCRVGVTPRFQDAAAGITAAQAAVASDPDCARSEGLDSTLDVHGRLLGMRVGDGVLAERTLLESLRRWERCAARS